MDWQSSSGPRRQWVDALGKKGSSALLVAPVSLLAVASLNWFFVKQALRIEFRDVRWIKTAELSDWISDGRRSQPILLDVRTRAEWKLSHLPGARWVDPQDDPATALEGVSKETAIVTYCSVGYRSATAARRLRAEGYDHVQNLEGSIFAWANEGRPLVHGDQPVRQVHPFSARWAKLLRPELRAPIAQAP